MDAADAQFVQDSEDADAQRAAAEKAAGERFLADLGASCAALYVEVPAMRAFHEAQAAASATHNAAVMQAEQDYLAAMEAATARRADAKGA